MILSSAKTVADLVLSVEKGKGGNHAILLAGLQASCYLSLLKIQLQQLFLLAELFPESSNPMGDAAPSLYHCCIIAHMPADKAVAHTLLVQPMP